MYGGWGEEREEIEWLEGRERIGGEERGGGSRRMRKR